MAFAGTSHDAGGRAGLKSRPITSCVRNHGLGTLEARTSTAVLLAIQYGRGNISPGLMLPGRTSEIRAAPVTKSLGSRIRQIRLQMHLTQHELAKRSGLLGSHISRIESGGRIPSMRTLGRLAGALHVSFYSLLFTPEDAIRVSMMRRQRSWDKSLAETGKPARSEEAFLRALRRSLSRLSAADRSLLLSVARKMARAK